MQVEEGWGAWLSTEIALPPRSSLGAGPEAGGGYPPDPFVVICVPGSSVQQVSGPGSLSALKQCVTKR